MRLFYLDFYVQTVQNTDFAEFGFILQSYFVCKHVRPTIQTLENVVIKLAETVDYLQKPYKQKQT